MSFQAQLFFEDNEASPYFQIQDLISHGILLESEPDYSTPKRLKNDPSKQPQSQEYYKYQFANGHCVLLNANFKKPTKGKLDNFTKQLMGDQTFEELVRNGILTRVKHDSKTAKTSKIVVKPTKERPKKVSNGFFYWFKRQ